MDISVLFNGIATIPVWGLCAAGGGFQSLPGAVQEFPLDILFRNEMYTILNFHNPENSRK
jgi:hypothetical protein